MDHFVLITGCSGGGKSSLLAELSRRGFAIVEEPGRRIVRDELAIGGGALPWADPLAFARRAFALALADRAAASREQGWVFFDRGLIDAAAAIGNLTGEPALAALAAAHRYHRRVFLAQPWPELFANDGERRHGWDAAVDEYGRIERALSALDYEAVPLPKSDVAVRADFVLGALQP